MLTIIIALLLVLEATPAKEESKSRQGHHHHHHQQQQLNFWGISMAGTRAIIKKILSVEQGEGVGARVRRSVGGREVSQGPD